MLITQCPDCHSLFRVTRGQLKLAEGKVRCGACLMVFDAIEHEMKQSILEDNPAGYDPESSSETTKASLSATETETETETKLPAESLSSNQKHEDESSDTSLTEMSVKQDSAEIVERAIAHPSRRSTDRPQTANASKNRISDPSLKAEVRPSNRAIPELHILVEPVVLRNERPEETDPGTVLFWLLASLLAIAALLSQYLWFERATLAHQISLRPVYQLVCEQLPCDLKGVQGLSTLSTEQVIVRPHKMFADLVSLSIKLHNEAAFYQPYPALEVSFTDLKGDLVSRRTFQPAEYLPTSDASSRLSPGLDLEIDIPLTDPGERAVSYRVELRQAN